MKEGDLVYAGENVKFLLRELTFKQFCDKIDDHCLEYDIDDAWEKWQNEGPVWEVFDENGKFSLVWKIELRKTNERS